MSYKHIKEYRRKRKEKLIASFGGKCVVCGYGKCPRSMCFHHTDPSKKKFQLSGDQKAQMNEEIIKEAKKCILVCTNCHGEIHDELIDVSGIVSSFDESLYKELTDRYLVGYDDCPVCGEPKRIDRVTCSVGCARKTQEVLDWSKVDLISLWEEHKNYSKIGSILGCSGNTVKNRLKGLGD